MRPNLRRSDCKYRILAGKPGNANNHLIQKTYFLIGIFSKLTIAGEAGQQLDAVQIEHGDIRGLFDFLISLTEKCCSPCVNRFGYFADIRFHGEGRPA